MKIFFLMMALLNFLFAHATDPYQDIVLTPDDGKDAEVDFVKEILEPALQSSKAEASSITELAYLLGFFLREHNQRTVERVLEEIEGQLGLFDEIRKLGGVQNEIVKLELALVEAIGLSMVITPQGLEAKVIEKVRAILSAHLKNMQEGPGSKMSEAHGVHLQTKMAYAYSLMLLRLDHSDSLARYIKNEIQAETNHFPLVKFYPRLKVALALCDFPEERVRELMVTIKERSASRDPHSNSLMAAEAVTTRGANLMERASVGYSFLLGQLDHFKSWHARLHLPR